MSIVGSGTSSATGVSGWLQTVCGSGKVRGFVYLNPMKMLGQ